MGLFTVWSADNFSKQTHKEVVATARASSGKHTQPLARNGTLRIVKRRKGKINKATERKVGWYLDVADQDDISIDLKIDVPPTFSLHFSIFFRQREEFSLLFSRLANIQLSDLMEATKYAASASIVLIGRGTVNNRGESEKVASFVVKVLDESWRIPTLCWPVIQLSEEDHRMETWTS
jgi:hypothetical protein